MTATVVIQEYNGTEPTKTTITSGRYCTADSNAPGQNNPCVVPSSGFNYSYWKHHALGISGTFSQISNIRWYTSGAIKTNWALGTGGMLLVGIRSDGGDNGCPPESYVQATGTVGTTGTPIETGHSYYSSQTNKVADADSYTSASPLLVDSKPYTTASSTKGVVTQVKINTDATQGDKASETLTFRYDEI